MTDPDASYRSPEAPAPRVLEPLDALGRILGGIDALRNLRALATLLGAFASAGRFTCSGRAVQRASTRATLPSNTGSAAPKPMLSTAPVV